MQTVINYVTAFWSVVVMNCIQPDNWKHCLPVQEWLLPDIIYMWELKTGQRHIYQSEKEYLKSVKDEKRLEDMGKGTGSKGR